MPRLVTFAIHGETIRVDFDENQLKLGTIVFVEFSVTGKPVAVLPQSSASSVPHAVRWIAPSSWTVELVSHFNVRPEFAGRIDHEIGTYITHAEIEHALTQFAARVRIDHFYKTNELANNPLSVVFTVLERLDVCKRLQQDPVRKALFAYNEPLTSYLYLTCFDLLGQPCSWLEFSAWLKSRRQRHRNERQEAKKRIMHSDHVEVAYDFYRGYLDLYGTKVSFFRFLHDILPAEIRRELLASIEMRTLSNPPELQDKGDATTSQKEAYLYRRRNDYTHKAGFTPPGGEWLGRSYGNPVQEFHAEHWTTIQITGWPEILDKVVRAGLASYLRAESTKKND